MKTKEEEVQERLKLAKRVKCLDKDVWFDLCDEFGKPLKYDVVHDKSSDDIIIWFWEYQKFPTEECELYKTCKVFLGVGVVAEMNSYPTKPCLLDELEKTKPSRPQRYASREVNGMDVIDLAEHWNLSFPEANILKYLLRNKGEDISDLEKIIDYAGRRIKQLNNK